MAEDTSDATLVVDHQHTAAAIGSGDVPALATPWLITLLERATIAAARDLIQPTETSVGVRVEVEHIAAAPIGSRVAAVAELANDDGRRMVFEVTASDGTRIVGRGTITRARVDRARFVESLG